MNGLLCSPGRRSIPSLQWLVSPKSVIPGLGEVRTAVLTSLRGNVVGDGGSTDLDTGVCGRKIAPIVHFNWPFQLLPAPPSPATERNK